MGFRQMPIGPVMTLDQFSGAALDRPLSPWATFTGSAADMALQTPGLGTAIREVRTPELAKTPLAGGRGGVRWRDKTAAEIAAEGDTLYQDAEKFKTSPSYRPDIPFEKGMTESRARALADMYDISQVRQFYASKRPIAAFLGGVAGSALDPVNYIPIVGGLAGVAAVARVGRIAGRAFIGSTDAALNSAIFQTALSGEKAKFGDDVSWAAIGTNAAFAAMAGAVIGGAVGGYSKFRHWSVDRPQPDIPEAVRPVVPEPVRPVVTPEPVRPADLTMSGEATARQEPVRNIAIDQVLSRLETAAMRTKAAEVMNDAIDGMIHDGEVRLGERSQAHVAEMQAAIEKAQTPTLRDVTANWDAQGIANFVSERNGLITVSKIVVPDAKRGLGVGTAAMKQLTDYADATGQTIALTPSADFGGAKGRLETFYKGLGFAENKGRSRDLAISETFIRQPQKISTPATMPVLAIEPSLRTTANYSVPALDPVPEGLATATAKIDANVKAKPDPAKSAFTGTSAKIKRSTTGPEAKAEPEDPLLAKDGGWRDDTVTVTVNGKSAIVKAGPAVDMLTSRMKTVTNLLECIRAS